MPRPLFSMLKPTHDIYGKKISKRKAFKTSTQKRVWMKAGGHNPDNWRTGFIKTSYCMSPRCKRKIIWGDGTYEFDHYDNNNSNNSERNCWLVCLFCHRRATKFGTKTKREKLTGMVIGKERYKKKVSYKKTTKKKSSKKKSRNRKLTNTFEIKIPNFRL